MHIHYHPKKSIHSVVLKFIVELTLIEDPCIVCTTRPPRHNISNEEVSISNDLHIQRKIALAVAVLFPMADAWTQNRNVGTINSSHNACERN